MIQRWSYLLVLLSITLMPASAFAGSATDMVRQKQTQLFTTIAKPKTAARQAQLRRLFDNILDYGELAQASLGKQWAKRSEAERKRFSELLEQLVRNNYKRNLKKMLDYNVEYASEEASGSGTLVKTRAKHKTNRREPPLQVDFRLKQAGGQWKVVDIITENASLTRTYRSQFLRIIRKKGFDKLIEKLQAKLDKQR